MESFWTATSHLLAGLSAVTSTTSREVPASSGIVGGVRGRGGGLFLVRTCGSMTISSSFAGFARFNLCMAQGGVAYGSGVFRRQNRHRQIIKLKIETIHDAVAKSTAPRV